MRAHLTVAQDDPGRTLSVREFHALAVGRFEIALETFLEKFEAANGEAEADRLRAAILAECEPEPATREAILAEEAAQQ